MRAKSMARAVMADLAYAQSRAMSTQARQFVRFSTRRTATSCSTSSRRASASSRTRWTRRRSWCRSAPADGRPEDCGVEAASFNGHQVLAFDELGTPYRTTR
jgi:hypothetical protein